MALPMMYRYCHKGGGCTAVPSISLTYGRKINGCVQGCVRRVCRGVRQATGRLSLLVLTAGQLNGHHRPGYSRGEATSGEFLRRKSALDASVKITLLHSSEEN